MKVVQKMIEWYRIKSIEDLPNPRKSENYLVCVATSRNYTEHYEILEKPVVIYTEVVGAEYLSNEKIWKLSDGRIINALLEIVGEIPCEGYFVSHWAYMPEKPDWPDIPELK